MALLSFASAGREVTPTDYQCQTYKFAYVVPNGLAFAALEPPNVNELGGL